LTFLVDDASDSGEVLTFRPEVVVNGGAEGVRIKFAHWEIVLPQGAFVDAPELQELLAKRSVVRRSYGPGAASLVALLRAQGCFLPKLSSHTSPAGLIDLFQPLRSNLYAGYYAHPLWTRLSTGSANYAELAAWIIHNYHVSRSAGVIAARMAARTSETNMKRFFRKDALEEFWHCDAFYFVDAPDLALDVQRVKQYVPLPASTAFEQLALRAAEEDALAHLLIAYFQESSIIFGRESEEFYDGIERHYRLPGFFAGWRRHMNLDFQHGHAEGLQSLFDSQEPLPVVSATRCIRRVQLAHCFLLQALDQIGGHTGTARDAVEQRQPEALAGRRPLSAMTSLTFAADHLLAALRDASFRCLAFARTHDEIILSGRLAAILDAAASKDLDPSESDNPWIVAISNFLCEQSSNVVVFLVLAEDVVEVVLTSCPEKADALNARISEIQLPPVQKDSMTIAVARAQLQEMFRLCETQEPLPALVIGISNSTHRS
jgi:hypothetical protein